jgi:hypothetical protein
MHWLVFLVAVFVGLKANARTFILNHFPHRDSSEAPA